MESPNSITILFPCRTLDREMMKKFLILAICFFLPIEYGYSQISLEELLNGAPSKNSSVMSEIIKQSVEKELSIIRQQYRLVCDGKAYGKNNLDYYGESYSLGVRISDGRILSCDVIEPWKNDADYNRLNSSNKYTPELFHSFERSLSSPDYQKIDFKFSEDNVHPLDSQSRIYVYNEKGRDYGFPIDRSIGEKSGYLVTISSSDSNFKDSTLTFRLDVSFLKIEASEDSSHLPLLDKGKILGGIFVVPRPERGGKIQLVLAGVAVPDSKGEEWYLCLFSETDGKKENAKCSDSAFEPTLIE